jgi:hypothetical protein
MMVQRSIFICLIILLVIGQAVAQDTAPIDSACITPSAENLQLDTTDGYEDAIQKYLSAGGNPVQLKSLLQNAGVIPDSTLREGVYITDLSGDGKTDVIINIAFPSQPPDVNTFVVWVFICNEANYRLLYEDSFIQVSPVLDHGIYINSVQDLNHDFHAEIIYHSVSCGVNTCYEKLNISGWDNRLQRIHSMLAIQFLLGDYTFADSDGDGIHEIIVTSGVSGSSGAGPQRRWQTTYAWDGINFTRWWSVPEQPRYGFEAAQDAAVAVNAGDLYTAASLYQRILSDPGLQTIDDRTDSITKSQALFGLLIIRMYQGDRETAAEIYTELQNFPGIPDSNNNLSESLWTKVGRTFYSLGQPSKFNEACDAVIAELNLALENERKSPGVKANYWGNFGNQPKPEDICPF